MKQRSLISLSNTKALTCDMGELIPCGLTEVLPGDTFQQSSSAFLRMAPMLAPIMGGPVEATLHHFFVPTRLVWDDFEAFITGGEDGEDASVFPTITFASGVAIGSLGDYLGLPTGVNGITVSAIPFRAYALIYNEWYRDQQLQTKLAISKASGNDTTTSVVLKHRNWNKDYFTSARPFEQLGPDITIPIGTSAEVTGRAPVRGIGVTGAQTWTNTSVEVRESGNVDVTPTAGNPYSYDSASLWSIKRAASPTDHPDIYTDADNAQSTMIADLSAVTGISVNDLREALALQRFEEARNISGGRYVELLRAWGVRSSDARLQRPEYIAGGTNNLQISEIVATAQTEVDTEVTNVGDLKGHGLGGVRSNRYRRYFEEHGYVITLLSVKPRTMYVQGIPRTWNRRTKEEFYNPEFVFLGQQAILNKELYAAHASPDGVFGYQNRYDDYRYIESTVAGEFRDTLDFWGMWRIFGSTPALDSTFVTSVPSDRIFAVPSADVLQVQVRHSIQARRKLPPRATPRTF